MLMFCSVVDEVKTDMKQCLDKASECPEAAGIVEGLQQMEQNLPVLESQYCSSFSRRGQLTSH